MTLSLLFEGKIPCVLSLHPTDNMSTSLPSPIHLMLPRQTYLHTGASLAVTQLRESSVAGLTLGSMSKNKEASSADNPPILPSSPPEQNDNSNVWFSHRGRPLRWQIPTGVLHDLLNVKDSPWEISVHFTSYPKTLLPFAGTETLQRLHAHSLKTSVYLSYGGDRLGNLLTREAQQRIWRSVEDNDGSSWIECADSFGDKDIFSDSGAAGGGEVGDEPNNVNINNNANSGASSNNNSNGGAVPVRIFVGSKEGKPFKAGRINPNDSVRAVVRSALETDIEGDDGHSREIDDYVVVVQGVFIEGTELDSKISELWGVGRHLDRFLYVVLRAQQ